MVLELKRGYTIESNYDKFTDSYITRLLDENGKQVRDALYSPDINGRNYDIQDIRDFFKNYMGDPNFNVEFTKEDSYANRAPYEPEEDDEFAELEPEETFEDEDFILEQPIEESLHINESLEVDTAYIIRNDGTVLKCDSFHPYIKEGNMNVNEFFYESAFDVSLNLFHEESKQQSVIKGIEALVNSFIHYHKDLKKDVDSHLKFNYSNGKIFDNSKLDLLYDKLNDLTNQEFCRVRTSSEYGSGGNSKDIYVRISSDNFDWSDIIYKFVANNSKFIESITIDKDNKSVKRPITYIHKGQKIDHMPIKDFLSLPGKLILEEISESELEKKARKTKRATKKAKLPALSKMSPIMPDYVAGISKFNAMTADGNSGMASTTGSTSLGEEYLDRDTLISRLKRMGFKYKFDKYSDKALYRIYQERKAKLEKQEAEKKQKQHEADLAAQKAENAKDSYFKDGIEFESEKAAKEYFGESMSKINESTHAKESMAKIAERVFNKQRWDTCGSEFNRSNNTITVHFPYSSIPDSSWAVDIEDALDKYEDGNFTVDFLESGHENTKDGKKGAYIVFNVYRDHMDESMKNKFYLNDLHEAWDIEEAELPKESLNESADNKDHGFKTLREGFNYFNKQAFNKNGQDIGCDLIFESMRDKLSSEDVKKLGAFMNHAQDADEVLTYMRGLLTKNQKLKESLNGDERFCYDYAEYQDGSTYIGLYSWDPEWEDWELYADVTTNIGSTEPNIIALNHDLSPELKQMIMDDFEAEVIDQMQLGMSTVLVVRIRDDWEDMILNQQMDMQATTMMDDIMGESLTEAFKGDVTEIDVESIKPQQKDFDRAEGLQFRGRTFKGNGQPFGSEARKMAKLITDPIKLVRRAKAVVATYGTDEGYMSNTGYSHYVEPDEETAVWMPFKRRLKEMGFTPEQISAISNYQGLKESLTESIDNFPDWSDHELRELIFDELDPPDDMEYDQYVAWVRSMDREDLLDVIDDFNLTPASQEFTVEPDLPEDADGATDALIELLSDEGFVLDDSLPSPVKRNMFGGTHIQIINPNLYYPTSETEGEELTEEEAQELFYDDIKPLLSVLDGFDKHFTGYLTYNIGANSQGQITAGVDIRI